MGPIEKRPPPPAQRQLVAAVIGPVIGQPVAGFEARGRMIKTADDAGEEVGIGPGESRFEESPGLFAVQRFVRHQGPGRKPADNPAGEELRSAGSRLGAGVNENVVVTVENRLQAGQGGDQATFLDVPQRRPQTDFNLPFANQIRMPGIGFAWVGGLGRGSGVETGTRSGNRCRRRYRRPGVARGSASRLATTCRAN